MLNNDEKKGHSSASFTVTMQQLSWISAAALSSLFFVFIAGYFLGQRKAVQEFSSQVDQESLADHIYSSMCVLYENKDEAGEEHDAETIDSEDEPEISEEVAVGQSVHYQAPLCGFAGSQKAAAQKMVGRLSNKGYTVELVERASISATGKSIAWYQVVLKSSENYEQTKKTVHAIAQLENLKEKSIRIDECSVTS